jgi:hypothetical protein
MECVNGRGKLGHDETGRVPVSWDPFEQKQEVLSRMPPGRRSGQQFRLNEEWT